MKARLSKSYELDLDKAVHLMISGTTGSGKSVAVNRLICELVSNYGPEELGLVLIDPKQVEFTIWKDIPHLVAPIVTNMDLAKAILNWAVTEMENRYTEMKERGIKQWDGRKIVIVIDELADLMTTDRNNVETSLVRLAQKARAPGIHLVLATQRPDAKVLTGLLRANIPTKMALRVASAIDSRIAIGKSGAERLTGCGNAIVVDTEGHETRFLVDYISESDIHRLIEQL